MNHWSFLVVGDSHKHATCVTRYQPKRREWVWDEKTKSTQRHRALSETIWYSVHSYKVRGKIYDGIYWNFKRLGNYVEYILIFEELKPTYMSPDDSSLCKIITGKLSYLQVLIHVWPLCPVKKGEKSKEHRERKRKRELSFGIKDEQRENR